MNRCRPLGRCSAPLLLAVGTSALLLACGGGGANAPPAGGGAVLPGAGGSGPGGGGAPASGLKGGVLATFSVGAESFRWWVTEPTAAQRLVDAWTGAAPAINVLGVLVEPGSGAAQHNAPWTWSASPQALRLLINPTIAPTLCFPYWALPSQVEAGFAAGPPYPCNDVNAGASWAEVRMNVALVGLQDLR